MNKAKYNIPTDNSQFGGRLRKQYYLQRVDSKNLHINVIITRIRFKHKCLFVQVLVP